jgi:hypothetical protein
MADIGQNELRRRVAILKRFRELLSQQRERFAQYLNVLDKQKESIEKGGADELISHVELEEKIAGDIFAIQKVIDPLEAMYKTLVSAAGTGFSSEEQELPGLRAALEELKVEAVIRSDRNRVLLTRRMEEIREEMKKLRANPYVARRSVYSAETPSLVDISG